MRLTFCAQCGKEFNKTSPKHIYCGNALKKTGCAYRRKIFHAHQWLNRHIDKKRKYKRDSERKHKRDKKSFYKNYLIYKEFYDRFHA